MSRVSAPGVFTFAELVDAGALSVTDGYRAKNSELGGDGLIFLRAGHVTDTHVDFVGVDRFQASLTPRLQDKLSQPGDVVVTTKGNSTGRTAYITESMPLFVYSPHLSRWRSLEHDIICPGYLRYWSRSREFVEQLHAMMVSTDMAPYLSLRDQSLLRVSLPTIHNQHAIAGVLGSLDDKIEVNRRTARVLEGIARTIFRSWFVDFDPVRRAAADEPAGLPDDLAALFPTRLVDSPLGDIPEGWRVVTIDSLCDSISSGGTPARMNKDFWEGGTIPWFKTGELFDAPLFASEEHITEAALANSSCKLWPAGTILFALYASPTVGRMGVLTRPGTSNQAAAGLIVKPEYGVPFLLNVLFFAREKFQQIAVGAAQQNINQGVLKSHQVVVPPASLARRFSQLMTTALDKQAQLSFHSAALASLRDALLPKLISGELPVPAAEAVIAAV